MARTADDIGFTDKLADDIGYVARPAHSEPHGSWVTAKGDALADWFDCQGIRRPSAVEVYISRRWDVSIQTAHAGIDSWKAARFRREDIESDPDARHSYGN